MEAAFPLVRCLTNTVDRICPVQKPEFCFLGYPDTREMLFHIIRRATENENLLPSPEMNKVHFGTRR